jgi:hypothetical protein
MAGIASKSFDKPDETRAPDKTKIEVLDLGTVKAARITFQPGWRWSDCVKPVVGTDSCQARHVGTVVSGRIHVKHDDGTETEMGPGDAYTVEPGHDAWVVGNEALVGFEFQSTTAATYGNRPSRRSPPA